MIDLLVVDDHTIFRAGLVRLVSDEPDMRVTGEAADGTTALAMIREHRYDVVLMDINMGARNGLETLAAIRVDWPRLPVIMLSMYVEAQYARLALRSRANAYLSKDVGPDELLRAIRHVAQGGVYVGVGLAPLLLADADGAADAAPHKALTPARDAGDAEDRAWRAADRDRHADVRQRQDDRHASQPHPAKARRGQQR
jgi:two-component system invasion response regulator UvrY